MEGFPTRLVPVLAISMLLVTPPAWTEDARQVRESIRKYSLGIGYAGSTIEVDNPRDGDDILILNGWGVSGRRHFSGPWALQLRYLSGEKDFSGGARLSLDQLNMQATFRLYESGREYFRVYSALGIARLDLDERVPPTGIFADRAFGAAVGVGLEYGPPRYAFFVDFNATFVDLRLAPGDSESWTLGNTITGFIYRF